MTTTSTLPTLFIKKLSENAQPIKQAYERPAGFDMACTHIIEVKNGIVKLGTEYALVSPETHYVLLYPRSSLPGKKWLLGNSVGVIDEDYRGQIIVQLVPTPIVAAEIVHHAKELGISTDEVLEKVAQKMTLPDYLIQFIVMKKDPVTIQYVETLPETQRGSGGFGSSDVNKK